MKENLIKIKNFMRGDINKAIILLIIAFLIYNAEESQTTVSLGIIGLGLTFLLGPLITNEVSNILFTLIIVTIGFALIIRKLRKEFQK